MQLPTDPESIREFEALVSAVEDTRRRWLEATAKLEDWLTARQEGVKVTVPAACAEPLVFHKRFTPC